jgi:DNA-binding GntR family transcriptional regulator
MSLITVWPSAPLADEIAEILHERIVEGRLAPEAMLSQRRLAEDLGVPRAVVGEALRMLRREGLVDDALPGGAMRVAEADGSVLLSAYVVRDVLDGLAASLAARHAGPGFERSCRTVLEDQRAAVSSENRRRYMRADTSFHATVIDAAGNPVLRRQWWPVRFTTRSAMLLSPAQLREGVEQHELILTAIGRGEPNEAERVARAHVSATIVALDRISPSAERHRSPRPP